MTMASSPRPGPRFAVIALVAAWAILLAVVGATVGYVAVRTQQMQTADSEAADPAAAAVALPEKKPAPEAGEAPPDPAEAAPAPVAEAPAPVAEPEAPEPVAEAEPATTSAAVEVLAETDAAPAETEANSVETAPAPSETETAALPPQAVAEPAPPAEAEAAQPAQPAQPETAPSETQEAAIPRAPTPEPTPLWQRNSQPFNHTDERPRIALVVSGLGLSRAATEAAIRHLPGEVTLSFTPYSRQLNEWIALARAYGHEALIDLPMEPVSYPDDDPGPQALLTALSPAQNRSRLDWALKRASGYVGVVPVMGSRFTASEPHIAPILEDLKARGLIFVDNRASDASVAQDVAARIGLPNAVNARFLDRTQASRVAVDERLKQLERIARTDGSAVAIGRPFPVTIELLRAWTKTLDEKGFVLAPISAIAAPGRDQRAAATRPPGE